MIILKLIKYQKQVINNINSLIINNLIPIIILICSKKVK